MRQHAMALLIFLHLKIHDRSQPVPALRTKALNVGLAEVFLGPVFVTDNVAGKEARIICLRKRLIGEECDRMIVGCPLPCRLLIAKPVDSPALWIDSHNEMRGLNLTS